MSGYPDNNPKTAIGVTKVPLHLVPPSAKHFLALALADGARKYGPYNWRDAAISVSVYKSALERHMDAYWDGEDRAPDSGVHHVAHAMACCALILDAMTVGRLNDDRPTAGAAPDLQSSYKPPIIPHGIAAAAMRDGVFAPTLAVAAGEPATGGGASSQITPLEPRLAGIADEEPPLRACATGGCND